MFLFKLGLWVGVPAAVTLIAVPDVGSFADFCYFFVLSFLALFVAILPHLSHGRS
ncbi:MAG: hypothetical protein M0Z84_01970 [Gammaproteobacteria bacterium]|nr:hypothetical protein [Gammaproteobacteria bacterium]